MTHRPTANQAKVRAIAGTIGLYLILAGVPALCALARWWRS